MAGNSIIQVPTDLSDEVVLKRFLQELVVKLSEVYGISGKERFITEQILKENFPNIMVISNRIDDIAFKSEINIFKYPISYESTLPVSDNQLPLLFQVKELDNIVRQDMESLMDDKDNIVKQDMESLMDDKDNIVKQWVNDNYVAKVTIAPLTQTISDPPTKEEVENIQNKINEIIGLLNA